MPAVSAVAVLGLAWGLAMGLAAADSVRLLVQPWGITRRYNGLMPGPFRGVAPATLANSMWGHRRGLALARVRILVLALGRIQGPVLTLVLVRIRDLIQSLRRHRSIPVIIGVIPGSPIPWP